VPDKIKRLTCPAEDAGRTIDLDSMTPADLVRWIAGAFPDVLKYNEVGDKAFLGRLKPTANVIPNGLAVPYFAQLDSATDQGPRMCFSSSCAMLAKFLKPNALGDGKNADDEYLSRVRQYGDTTEAGSQLKALAHLGVKAVFRQDLGWKDLDKQLLSGKPVPIGILHRGHVSAPTGGGHWIVVIGKQGESYRVHDPAGDLDLVSGQYMGNNGGKGLLYSKQNLGPRWMVDGPGTGWGILA
jgi:hypothetical protein